MTPLEELFHAGESPYFAMHRAGIQGWGIDEVSRYCQEIGVPLREKDVANWQAGAFRAQLRKSVLNPLPPAAPGSLVKGKAVEDSRFEDLEKLPDNWLGTPKRWFPCNMEGMPMQKWGWTEDFEPCLYDEATARALSPRGWVGQNMLYQNFIVLDIDGAGHGERDDYVIAFGEMFKDRTLTYENPLKPGSFHLYFCTDRLVPLKHFPYAKLDLMGNTRNAAVYLKDKRPNGLPMMKLTHEVWEAVKSYVRFRKENRS